MQPGSGRGRMWMKAERPQGPVLPLGLPARGLGWLDDTELAMARNHGQSYHQDKDAKQRGGKVDGRRGSERLLSPRTSPDKNPGVGSYSLLRGIFLRQESNPGLPQCRRIPYWLSYWGSPCICTHRLKFPLLDCKLFKSRKQALSSILAFQRHWERSWEYKEEREGLLQGEAFFPLGWPGHWIIAMYYGHVKSEESTASWTTHL